MPLNSGLPMLTGLPVGWRPPQWSKPPMFSMASMDPATGAVTGYVFDNIPRVLHEQQGVVTLNPVQDGAPISDHFYVVPARLTVEILMSDSMQSYTFGQFSDGVARSVSCWQTLKALQASKAFVTIVSRLDTYDNMLITDRRGEETPETTHAGRFTVTFTQVLIATVTLTNAPTTNSTRPQATGQTQAGQVQPQVVPTALIQQFVERANWPKSPNALSSEGILTGAYGTRPRAANVPAAGNYSSNPIFSHPPPLPSH